MLRWFVTPYPELPPTWMEYLGVVALCLNIVAWIRFGHGATGVLGHYLDPYWVGLFDGVMLITWMLPATFAVLAWWARTLTARV